jgi:hypothetical protein
MCTAVSLFGSLPRVRLFIACTTRNAKGFHRHHFEFGSVEEAERCYICWQGSLAEG